MFSGRGGGVSWSVVWPVGNRKDKALVEFLGRELIPRNAREATKLKKLNNDKVEDK